MRYVIKFIKIKIVLFFFNLFFHHSIDTISFSSLQLFDHVFADNAQINEYNLTALIAYYGRHYSTFCYHSKMREWVYFDDAKFRTVRITVNF